jgi:hypothetical protein
MTLAVFQLKLNFFGYFFLICCAGAVRLITYGVVNLPASLKEDDGTSLVLVRL